MINKYVVFDLDETLGYFTQIGMFRDAIKYTYDISLSKQQFFMLCDLYPNILRPGILSMLRYIKKQKVKIVIYTNNLGEKEWPNLIKDYLSYKLNDDNLFYKIICAYEINNTIIEECRTTNEKTYNDLIRCLSCKHNTKILFFDDQYHYNMTSDNVTYINVKSYEYFYKHKNMIKLFKTSLLYKKLSFKLNEESLLNYLNRYNLKLYKKKKKELEIDKIISKKMMYYIQTFLNIKLTQKKHVKKNNKNTYKFIELNN